MATGLTKTALIRHVAEKLELTNKQVGAFFDLLDASSRREFVGHGGSPCR